MSHLKRMLYVTAGTIANAVQVLVFFRIGTDVFALGEPGGEYAGPFSHVITWVETAWMVEIAIVQLGLLLYLVYGPVLQERARARVAPPP
jgi:hypothetical protein